MNCEREVYNYYENYKVCMRCVQRSIQMQTANKYVVMVSVLVGLYEKLKNKNVFT